MPQDNNQDDLSVATNSSCSSRQLIAKFAGHKTVIRADLWLNLFEVATRGKDDQTRIFTLMSYLIDDALNWFAAEIAPRMDDIKWMDVRDEFIARFGPAIANPLVESQHRRLRASETVQNYYDDKMRILRRVTLSEIDVVAQLSEGMPPNYRGYLLCASPKTANAWLAVALQLEATLGRMPRQDNRSFNKGRQPVHVALTAQSAQKQKFGKQEPSAPCRYCLEAGETLYHWHRDCKRRKRNDNRSVATNSNQNVARESSQAFAPTTALAAQPIEQTSNSSLVATPICSISGNAQGNFPGGRH